MPCPLSAPASFLQPGSAPRRGGRKPRLEGASSTAIIRSRAFVFLTGLSLPLLGLPLLCHSFACQSFHGRLVSHACRVPRDAGGGTRQAPHAGRPRSPRPTVG